MADTALATTSAAMSAQTLEQMLLEGDIKSLTPQQRVAYMLRVCESLGLNPLTRPFGFMTINGKYQMYAKKDCTEQLRKIHGISTSITSRVIEEGCYVVTAKVTDKTGRYDEDIGAVPIEGVKGEARANALMKAHTKAKRRATLSLAGLGIPDESEIDSIPGARVVPEGPSSLDEKLKASIVVNDEKKKAQQLVEQAATDPGGEVVEGEFEQPEQGADPDDDWRSLQWPFGKRKGKTLDDDAFTAKDVIFWIERTEEQLDHPQWGAKAKEKLPKLKRALRAKGGAVADEMGQQ